MARSRMQPVSPKTAPTRKRTYDSSRRRRQAAETRTEVLVAAMRLFAEEGWTGTTVAAIAKEAGVAVETVYSGFGSKKALVRDAYDASVVGDAEPVPLVDRPVFARMAEGSVRDRLHAGMDMLADIHERSSGTWRALLEAASGDDDLTAWMREAHARRRIDVGRSLERIFERTIPETQLDLLWVLFSPETWWQLVHDRGYSRAQFEHALATATLLLLGEDPELFGPAPTS